MLYSKGVVSVILAVLLLFSATLSDPAYAIWPFGPNNYDECISKEMKGVSSDIAARVIARSCRKRFPEKQQEERTGMPIPQGEIKKITGHLARDSGFCDYSGKIHNGSPYVITDIFFIISTYDLRGNNLSNKTYRVSKKVGPLIAESICINALRERSEINFGWGIQEVWGYRQ